MIGLFAVVQKNVKRESSYVRVGTESLAPTRTSFGNVKQFIMLYYMVLSCDTVSVRAIAVRMTRAGATVIQIPN